MLTARADDGVLSLGLWEAEDGTAGGAFFIDMLFAIAKLVATQAEESAEFLVFASADGDLSREHTRKDP